MAGYIEVGDLQGAVDVVAELSEILYFEPDMTPIRQEAIRILADFNRVERLAGVDKRGATLEPLAESTRKGRDGDPTPFVEHGDASRVISAFIADVDFDSRTVLIRMSWAGCGWLEYHAQGAGRNPVRDILGLPPETVAILDDLILEQSDRQFRESIRDAKLSRSGPRYPQIGRLRDDLQFRDLMGQELTPGGIDL